MGSTAAGESTTKPKLSQTNYWFLKESWHGEAWTISAAADHGVRGLKNKKTFAQLLYLVVAQWKHLPPQEQDFFRKMSEHVEAWVKLLALIPGNDYLERLATQKSVLLISH